MTDNANQDRSGGQTTAIKRAFPFRLVLPLSQLLLCAVLIVIFCGPRSLIVFGLEPASTAPITAASTMKDHSNPASDRRAQITITDHVLRVIAVVNLPGGVLQVPIMRYSRAHPALAPTIFKIFTSHMLSWSLLSLPFWWIAGRGLDALIAMRRNLLAPLLHWTEGTISFVLLFMGVTAGSVCIWTIATGRGQPGLATLGPCELFWSILGGITVLARSRQRRMLGAAAAAPNL
jgi:hypothetical protein